MAHQIFDLIAPSVAAHPGATALVTPEGEAVTYGVLGKTIGHYADRLAAAGVNRGRRVALHAVSMTQFLLLLFALSRLGVVMVRSPDDEEEGGAGVDLVVVDRRSGLAGPKVLALDLTLAEADAEMPSAIAPGFESDDDMFLVLGTSGTTGHKKQLGYSQALLRQRIDDLQTNLGAFAPRTLVHVPPAVSFGLMIALLKLRAGGTVVLPGVDHEATLKRLIDGAADDIISPPAIYSILVSGLVQRDLRLSSIKRAISGGGPVSPALISAIKERICANFTNCYGSSETGNIAAAADVTGLPEGAVGRIASWVEIRVAGENGEQVPAGTLGRIMIRLRNGRRFARAIGAPAGEGEAEWFDPGDMGLVTQDGILCLRGRAGEAINLGGNKLVPSEIERAAGEFLGEREFICAFGILGPHGFDEVALIVSTRHSAQLKDLPGVLERAGIGLGRAHILALKDFPLNEFGKIDRVKLKDMAAREIARRRGGQQWSLSTKLKL